jgi:hypothetical protein
MYFPPAEMGVRATSSNASEQLFGNTTDYDEETEDLLMFHCLHADYHGISTTTTVFNLQRPKFSELMKKSSSVFVELRNAIVLNSPKQLPRSYQDYCS